MKYKYQNPSLTIHERIIDLMSRLSIKEKVGQINQKMYGWQAYKRLDDGTFVLTETFKEHVAFGGGIGALYGIHRADPWSGINEENGISVEDSKRVTNMIQRYIVENSRFGIPALIVEECPHGHQALNSTSYPVNITKASSFDVDMIRDNARVMADELSRKGVHLALVSTLDLGRDPRWGRTEETFGEDPLLAKEYTQATIEGFQGKIISESTKFTDMTVKEIAKSRNEIGVILKHCIAQGDALGGHNGGSVNTGSREFHDIYQPLLDACKNAVGVMAAYNEIDGVPCHVNQRIFKDNLRDRVGFQGIVMSDGCALDRLNAIFGDPHVSASKALNAGVDLSLWDDVYTKVQAGIETGKIDEKALDAAVYNVLSIKFLLGLFEEDFSSNEKIDVDKYRDSWSNLNRKYAESSITLLENDGILPLDTNYEGTIAVIGPNGNTLLNLLGDYTPRQDRKYETTIYKSIKKKFQNANVKFELGCEIRDKNVNRINDAIKLAKDADLIILALGGSSTRNFDMNFMNNGAVSSKGHNMDTGENVDLSSLRIGGNQIKLYQAISEIGKPIITIMVQGRPFELHDISKVSNALLVAWYPGQMGGDAIANILDGTVSPSGRMPITTPKHSGVIPVYYNGRNTGRPDQYYDLKEVVSYEFGSGLTYANVEIKEVNVNSKKVSIDSLRKGEKIRLQYIVENNSSFGTKYTCLLFVKRIGGSIIQRRKELKAFKKIELKAKDHSVVEFELGYDDFVTLDMSQKLNLYPCLLTFKLDNCEVLVELV